MEKTLTQNTTLEDLLGNSEELTNEEGSAVQQLWIDKPEVFFEDILGVEFWAKQREIVESLKAHRRTAVRSSNSAGKTWSISRIALWFLFSFANSLVINTAPTHRQVENQFWRNLRYAHNKAKIKLGGKLLKTALSIDEDWFAIGFTTGDGEGAMEAFAGWHAKNMLVIVDEASGVHPRVFEAIEGAMAGGATVRLILIGNPTRNNGDFAEAFKDPIYNKIHISAFDVPNVQKRMQLITGLATWEWVQEMKSKYGEDSDIYRVRVLGEFPQHEVDTLISIDSVSQAIDAEREIYGEDEYVLLDPARFGNDKAAFVYRKGNYAMVLEEIASSDTMTLAGKMVNWLEKYPKAQGRIDIIGLGAGIFDRLKELPKVRNRVVGVNVSVAAGDKEHYGNMRVESWDLMRLWLRDAILEKHEGWYELSKPKMKIRSDGKMMLESKEEMRKRGVSSPNIGDALALSFAKPSEGGSVQILWA